MERDVDGWLWVEELGGWVLDDPSAEDEQVLVTEVVRYGKVAGLRVECIIKSSDAEGGGVVMINPRWTLLMEALARGPSTANSED